MQPGSGALEGPLKVGYLQLLYEEVTEQDSGAGVNELADVDSSTLMSAQTTQTVLECVCLFLLFSISKKGKGLKSCELTR